VLRPDSAARSVGSAATRTALSWSPRAVPSVSPCGISRWGRGAKVAVTGSKFRVVAFGVDVITSGQSIDGQAIGYPASVSHG
jgi:hypothetical protein